MALRTAGHPPFDLPVTCHTADKGFVAIDTVVLQGQKIFMRDPDRFRKILKRKGPGVIPAVSGFGQIFFGKGMRHVAVVASRRAVVAGLNPGIKMALHDMAIHTSLRIIAKIRSPLCVVERITSKPY
jgi:hypothetical protein